MKIYLTFLLIALPADGLAQLGTRISVSKVMTKSGPVCIWEGLTWRVNIPDSKVHGANMGTIWGRQDLGGPQVGPMNFAIGDSPV